MQEETNNMFYGAPPVIHQQARSLRKRQTEAEKILWNFLSNRKLRFKFRRQHPIHQFIVDFYCHELKLVIEVDGLIHLKVENREYDEDRTKHLENFGLTILRFNNSEVLENPEDVVLRIKFELDEIQNLR